MTEHEATYSVTEERKEWQSYPREVHSASCSCGEWESLGHWNKTNAQSEFQRHLNRETLKVGIYECGCLPVGRPKRMCYIHRKPYIPKTPRTAVKPPLVSSKQIIEALERRHHDKQQWATMVELRVSTGYSRAQRVDHCNTKGEVIGKTWHRPGEKSLDFYAMNLWPSKKFERIAYEVKVTRNDFMNEIRKPYKRESGMAVSNKFFFVAPPGVIPKDRVPEGCGLLEVQEDLSIKQLVSAPHRNADSEPDWRFVAALVRAASRTRSDSGSR